MAPWQADILRHNMKSKQWFQEITCKEIGRLSINTKSDINFNPAFKLWTKSIIKFWIMEINASKWPSINTTYACRRQSNSLKWYMIYLYLPIHYSSFSQPFRRRGTLDLALHIARYPLRKTSIFLNWFTFYLFVTWET